MNHKVIILLRKELLEQWRSARFIILLAVFLFFGIVSPLAARFMPEIVSSLAMEQNVVITMPEGTWQDSAQQFIKNISQMGVLILIILLMGSVAREKESGTADFLLVKPVSRNAFLLSKHLSAFIALIICLGAGLGVAILYTRLFFGVFNVIYFIRMAGVLLVFLLTIQSITLFFSSILRSHIPAGILALAAVLLSGSLSIAGTAGKYSPSHLVTEAGSVINNIPVNAQPFISSSIVIIMLFWLSLFFFRKWEA